MVTVIWGNAEEKRTRLLTQLRRLTSRLRTLDGVEQVWLFGSALTGEVHAGSDLDLLVVRRTEQSAVDRRLRLAAELVPGEAVDWFVYTPEEFSAGGRFIDQVRREGRRLV